MMLKKIVLFGFVTIIAAGGGAWFYAKREAQITAENEVESFLIKNGLKPFVTYDSIIASPFGMAELSNITLRSSEGINFARIGSLQISNIEIKNDVLLGAKVEFTSFEFLLLDTMRTQGGAGAVSQPFLQAIGMGYTTLKGNMSFQWNFEENRQTVALESKGGIQGMGNFEAKVKFGGVSMALISPQLAKVQTTRRDYGSAIMAEFAKAQTLNFVTLHEARLILNDDGYFKRDKAIPNEEIPKDISDSDTEKEKTTAYTKLVEAGMTPSDARLTVESIGNWLSNGGSLRIESNLNQPIRLLNQDSPNMPWILKFIAAAKIKISQ